MNHLGSLPDSQWLLDVLRARNTVPDSSAVGVRPLARNNVRRDAGSRRAFAVWDGNNPMFYVVIGTQLAALHQVARSFASEVPSIASKPLFFFGHEGLEILGSEYRAGHRLDTAVREKLITQEQFASALAFIKRALAQTELDSSPALAAREFQQFQDEILGLEHWSEPDRLLLRDAVLPFVSARMISSAPKTRWSNGDLTASNILLGDDGAVHLIDYEFAQRTHFFGDDDYRFAAFSNLSDHTPVTLPPPKSPQETAEHLYFLLNHARLIASVLPTRAASDDILLIARQILALFTPIAGASHGSVSPPLEEKPSLAPSVAPAKPSEPSADALPPTGKSTDQE